MRAKIRPKRPLFPIVFTIVIVFAVFILVKPKEKISDLFMPMSYRTNIFKKTEDNEDFRHILFTGSKSQLVVMSIPPGGEIGEEVHKYTEQALFFLSGTGEGALDDRKFLIDPGDVVVVTAGTKHNFWNTGKDPLKLYTVYSPPNHIDGRIHHTKADADTDTEDEAIGETAPLQ